MPEMYRKGAGKVPEGLDRAFWKDIKLSVKALLASCLVIVLTMNSYEYNYVSEGDHTMDDLSMRESGRGYLGWLCDHRLVTVTTDLVGGGVDAGFMRSSFDGGCGLLVESVPILQQERDG